MIHTFSASKAQEHSTGQCGETGDNGLHNHIKLVIVYTVQYTVQYTTVHCSNNNIIRPKIKGNRANPESPDDSPTTTEHECSIERFCLVLLRARYQPTLSPVTVVGSFPREMRRMLCALSCIRNSTRQTGHVYTASSPIVDLWLRPPQCGGSVCGAFFSALD